MNEKRKEYLKQYQKHYKAKRVNLTLSDKEYQEFSRMAKNTKIATYIKSLAVAGLESQTLIPENIEKELKTLNFAIRNIANNINQLTHYSNIIRELGIQDEHNLLQHLKQLDEVVSNYTKGKINQK
ncbi:hypothetical protein [uncultured Gammaproteobacteria bacterium]|nr:hypothetical protein [uncultured Gammaproteobacteria bacterium]